MKIYFYCCHGCDSYVETEFRIRYECNKCRHSFCSECMDKIVCNKCRDEHNEKHPEIDQIKKVPFNRREEIPNLIRGGYIELGIEKITNLASGVSDEFFVMMFDERFYKSES